MAVAQRGFNPTLVRLRRASLDPSGRALPEFQSHAGSIEASDSYLAGGMQNPFQSHAGSIEAGAAGQSASAGIRFQSHAGSIEAEIVRQSRAAPGEFQSHAGSIEAPDATAPTWERFLSFNPTLVRLRQKKDDLA